MRFSIFILSLFVTVGCAKESSNSSSPSSNRQSPSPDTDRKSNYSQVLKIYDGTDQNLNSIQEVNVSSGQLAFDFTFKAIEDLELSLPVFFGKFYLIGCKESDIATDFEVFHSDPNGKLDSPTKFPVLVKQGNDYVIRVNLYLRTSCLGLRYNFAIQSFR